METVNSQFEEIFEVSDYDKFVAERYHCSLLLLMRHGPPEVGEPCYFCHFAFHLLQMSPNESK